MVWKCFECNNLFADDVDRETHEARDHMPPEKVKQILAWIEKDAVRAIIRHPKPE